ncbi:putative phage tailspike protein [Vibrio phage 409E50-1]|nr:putative phage tailspike protein [Vibrio phage 521E56-1]CAH9013259.1 putative phage tailspike protein [Vibrio phage 384E50-1]CAH9013266.1 putative phage tailspike protein [Vibrio phage 409E50-1]CAH9013294.1 putative phage tailspike protein [Vibrio phage 402E50-1]CAH9013915.1 putative phage tailspike protein [Vibrio phage 405E50-1]CAH9013979.1 putative phage tailspike protein [Vibrio phage 413E50-1]
MPLVLDPIQSGYNLSKINDNFQRIEDTWDEKLDRVNSGSFYNQMDQTLDMNSNEIINVKVGDSDGSLVTKGYVDTQDSKRVLKAGDSMEGQLNTIDPVQPSNATNKRYVDGMIASIDGVEGIVPLVSPRQQGDGVTTVFPTVVTSQRPTQSYSVNLDGVTQRPQTDYTADTNGNVVFSEAPEVGVDIDITVFEPVNLQEAADFSQVTATTSGNTKTLRDWMDVVEREDVSDKTVIAAGTSVQRSLADRFADVVNVKDFGAVGNGIIDDTSSIQAAVDHLSVTGGKVIFPLGVYIISQPIKLTPSILLQGGGQVDMWGTVRNINQGTVLKAVNGSYAGEIWSDTTGFPVDDNANFKPMLVLATNCGVDNMTLQTDDEWNAALYLPCVKRVSITRCSSYGNWRSGLFLDATWSDRNTYLKGLHPDVYTDTGLNEFFMQDCYLEGLFGVELHGTTRDASDTGSYPDWNWCWGGASDMSFNSSRFGTNDLVDTIPAYGGALRVDAAVRNSPEYNAVNRIWFSQCSFRVGSSRYCVLLDRVGTIQFDQCSGETVGGSSNPNWITGTAPFYVTDNTKKVFRSHDTIVAEIEYNGSGFARTWENNGTRPDIYVESGLNGELSTPFAIRGNDSTDATTHLSGGAHSFKDMTADQTIALMYGSTLELPGSNPRVYATGDSLRLATNNSARQINIQPNNTPTLDLVNGTSIFHGAARPAGTGQFLGTGGFPWQGIYMRTQDGTKKYEVQLNNTGDGFVFTLIP